MAAAKPGFLTLRGGKFRGKKIPIPGDGSVRPTTDRAREQAFALLDQHFRHADGRARWRGARVLDAFAGTGALGLEAASRGAETVHFWDTSLQQINLLKQALKSLPAFQAHVDQGSALSPSRATKPMDLIFLDPPYGKGLAERSLMALEQEGWIADQTLIYAETELGTDVPAGYLSLAERKTASSVLRLLKPGGQSAS